MKKMWRVALAAMLALALALAVPAFAERQQQNQGQRQQRLNQQRQQDPETAQILEDLKAKRQEIRELAKEYKNAAEADQAAIAADLKTKIGEAFDLQTKLLQRRITLLEERLTKLKEKKTERDGDRTRLIDERLNRIISGRQHDNRDRENN